MARLLLVDDDNDVLTVLRTGLEAHGHEAIAFSDPAEARNWLLERTPDGVLLDVRMPKISGWDLLQQIRAERRLERLPVVMLSANGDVEERVRGLRLGADDFCVKPFHVEEVVARVEGLLARRNLSPGAIQGDLSTLPLADVLQNLELQKLSGVLEIGSGPSPAAATFQRGRCLQATCGELTGGEALLELLALRAGSFRFAEAGAAALEETLAGSAGPWLPRASELLLDSAWIEDELAKHAAMLPEPTARLSPGPATLADLEADAAGWLPPRVAEAVAAAGAPEGVAARTFLARLACSTSRARLALGTLLGAGVLAVRAPESAPADVAAPGEPPAVSRLLEALRAEVPGFFAAALFDRHAGRAVGSISLRDGFDPVAAVRFQAALPARFESSEPPRRFEDALFSFDDQLHLLRATGDGRLLYLAASRTGGSSEALVRNAVRRSVHDLSSESF